nr:MAG TPA: hypothetical protein [Caudoviricetes sp.]
MVKMCCKILDIYLNGHYNEHVNKKAHPKP